MAKIKEIVFHKTLKLSHSYNSFDVGFGITVSLDDNDNVEEVKEKGWNTVDNEIEKQIKNVVDVLAQLSGD